MHWLTEWCLAANHDCFGNHALEGESVCVCWDALKLWAEKTTLYVFYTPSHRSKNKKHVTSSVFVSARSAPTNICLLSSLPLRVVVHPPVCVHLFIWSIHLHQLNHPGQELSIICSLSNIMPSINLILFTCQLQRRLQAPLWMEGT